jgi:hypothetical protein
VREQGSKAGKGKESGEKKKMSYQDWLGVEGVELNCWVDRSEIEEEK